MYRMKQLLGDSLTLRDYDGQVAEAMAMVRVEQDDKGWDARKRAYCLKIQPATGSFARNLIYSTKPTAANQGMPTRSPIVRPDTPSPSASTRPTMSWPGMIGMWGWGSSPSTTCRSVRHTPQAKTFTRIRRERAFCLETRSRRAECRQHSGPLHASGPPLFILPIDDAAIC